MKRKRNQLEPNLPRTKQRWTSATDAQREALVLAAVQAGLRLPYKIARSVGCGSYDALNTVLDALTAKRLLAVSQRQGWRKFDSVRLTDSGKIEAARLRDAAHRT